MKTWVGVMGIGLGLLAQSASAQVTPAHQAMNQVKVFLDAEVERRVQEVIPQHKAANHLIQFQSNLMRGKYSESHGGFSDFFGTTKVMVQIGATHTIDEVTCSVSASAQVVPFAMQQVPVLEEVVNEEQLVLKRQHVRCRLR